MNKDGKVYVHEVYDVIDKYVTNIDSETKKKFAAAILSLISEFDISMEEMPSEELSLHLARENG